MSIQDSEENPIEYPITSEIDLHTFRPNEVNSLLREYIKECRERDILEIRVVHGKGTGALREGVHRLLDQMHNEVRSYRLGDETSGSWGATLVILNKFQ
ncbi:MAG: DNA mismatch repair protein MutS [Verrucomicrobiales bacterium]|nr:DNA mismatch repair protein MutS [Verrucomicrobiales bacterium]